MLRTDSGLFVSFFVADAGTYQEMLWLSESGVIQHRINPDVSAIYHTYLRGDTAVLVELCHVAFEDPEWYALILHGYLPSGQRVLEDTLLRRTLPLGTIIADQDFADREGALTAMVLEAAIDNQGSIQSYIYRGVRAGPAQTRVFPPQLLLSGPVSGLLIFVGVEDGPRGIVVAMFREQPGGTGLLFASLDADGQIGDSLHRQSLYGDVLSWNTSMLEHDGTVYALYTTAESGTKFTAFPLSEIAPVPPHPGAPLPERLALELFPNPFNSALRLRFDLPAAGLVTCEIFDITGRRVFGWPQTAYAAGSHELLWQADRLSSGVYFVRLGAPRGHVTAKALLMQ